MLVFCAMSAVNVVCVCVTVTVRHGSVSVRHASVSVWSAWSEC